MMLERSDDRRRRMSAALVASLALHLVLLALIPSLVAVRSRRPSVATIAFARVARIELAHTRRTPQPARSPEPPAPPAPRQFRQMKPRPLPVAPAPASQRPARRRTLVASAPIALAAAPASPSPAPSTTPGPAASASPAPVRLASTERLDRGGYMPFGARQARPVLDAITARRLQALDLHATMKIRVDGNGRILALSFTPPIDAASRERVLALLANASWDPAVCGGGLACTGETTIRL